MAGTSELIFGEMVAGMCGLQKAVQTTPSFDNIARLLSSIVDAIQATEATDAITLTQTDRKTITASVERCQTCVRNFVEQISVAQAAPTEDQAPESSPELFQKSIQRVDWSLCKRWDIEQLRRELLVHKVTILSLQDTILSAQGKTRNCPSDKINEIVAIQQQQVEDIQDRTAKIDEDENQDCLEALFVSDTQLDIEGIETRKGELLESACQWILGNRIFQEMLESDESELLWIHGLPGKGKTMMAMYLIDFLSERVEMNPQDVLACFFCDNNIDKRNSTLYLLKSILFQVIRQSPQNVLLKDFARDGRDMFSTIEAVWTSLMKVFRASASRTIYLVIDGLDECTQESLDVFLTLFKTLGADKGNSLCNVKFIFTSRNTSSIRENLLVTSRVISLEEESEHVAQAVDRYVDFRVEELAVRKRYDQELMNFVAENLKRKSGGSFLWVSIACTELLRRNVSFITTKLVLGKLPSGLPEVYTKLYEQVLNGKDKDLVQLAVEVLRAVTIAIRPLHLCELAVVAGLPSDGQTDAEVSRRYADLCGSFLTIDNDHVYFVHQSAKDYLLELQKDKIFSTGLIRENEKAAIRCLQYICYDWKYYKEIFEEQFAPEQRKNLDSLQYPLLHWIEHSNIAGGRLQKSYRLNHSFFRANSELRQTWLRYFCFYRQLPNLDHINTNRFSALHISATCDTWWVTEILLRETGTKHVDVQDCHGLAPLHWSIHLGNVTTAKVLLQKGADPNNRGGRSEERNGPRCGTPLGLAISYNDMAMTKLLLRNEADIDYPDFDNKTPLSWTIEKDQPHMAELLLREGADPIIPDTDGQTPMHLACASGNLAITKLLLDAGASPDSRDDNDKSPSHEADLGGHVRVKSLLQKYGAIEVKTDDLKWIGNVQALPVIETP